MKNRLIKVNNFTTGDIAKLAGVSLDTIRNIVKFTESEESKYIDFDLPMASGEEAIRHYTEKEAMKFIKFLDLLKTDKRVYKIFDSCCRKSMRFNEKYNKKKLYRENVLS